MASSPLPSQRRVARAPQPGGLEVVAVAVEELSPLKPGEALVRVEAAGLNHLDSLARSGAYSIRFPFPFPVGVEGAGTIVAVGAGFSFKQIALAVPGT